MRYTPILKGKSGEGAALSHLSNRTLDRTFPVIEIPPIPTKYCEERPGEAVGPSRTLQQQLDAFVRGIGKQIPAGLQFAIDFSNLSPDLGELENPVEYVFSKFAALGRFPTPVLRLSEEFNFAPELLEQVRNSPIPAVVRISKKCCSFPTLMMGKLEALLQTAGLPFSRVGVLFDYGLITRGDIADVVESCQAIEEEMPLNEFSFSSMVSTSMPNSVTMGLKAYSTDSVPRLEWQAWKQTRPGILGFGDYGVNSLDYFDEDVCLITLAGKARYTTPNSWMIVKGVKLKENGDQFYKIAGMIRNSNCGKGSGYSWGDDRIHACANLESGPGNLESWVAFTLNHHLTMVAKQLASAA